jgi:hypothetical protein
MKRLAVLAGLVLAACGTTDEGSLDSTLTIDNNSSYTLIEIYLSPTSNVSWGSDLLGSNVLEPGDAYEVSGIECATYDIRIVDEDHDECVLDSVDLCLDNAVWSIDDGDLALCAF